MKHLVSIGVCKTQPAQMLHLKWKLDIGPGRLGPEQNPVLPFHLEQMASIGLGLSLIHI